MQHSQRQRGENQLHQIVYLGVIALFLLLSLPAMAEVGDMGLGDGLFNTDTDNLNGDGGNGQVNAAGGGEFVGSMLADPNSIQSPDSLDGNGMGRQEKTDDSIETGNAGVAGAIAAGTALTAAGVAKLPFPTTPQGVALIALGALEFAQAGATAGATSQNKDGKGILSQGTPEGEQAALSQQQVAETIKKQIDTPELQKALADNGVNSDDFVNRLASGELRNFEDIMAAINSPHDFSTDQIAQAQADAMAFASGAMGAEPEKNGVTEVARIRPDDSEKRQNAPSLGGGGGGVIGVGPAVAIASQISEENQRALEQAKEMIRKAEKLADAELAQLRRAGLGAGLSRDALVRKYLAQLKKRKNANPLANLSRSQMVELGIKELRSTQKIFDISRRTYTTYARWRAKAKQRDRMERLRRLQARVAARRSPASE